MTNLGFARDGSILVIIGVDGTIRRWDLVRDEPAGLVWDGTGSVFAAPSWYDTDSVEVATSGLLIEVPLGLRRWVERVCDLVGPDLSEDEGNGGSPAPTLPDRPGN